MPKSMQRHGWCQAWLLLLGLLMLVIPREAFSGGEFARASLKGLRGVHVTEPTVDDALSRYVIGSDMQTAIELRMRKAGVRLYTEEEKKADPTWPALFVDVIALPVDSEANGYACSVEMELVQAADLVRPATAAQSMLVVTWSDRRLLVLGTRTLRDGRILATVERMTDGLINDWLASHPASSAGKP